MLKIGHDESRWMGQFLLIAGAMIVLGCAPAAKYGPAQNQTSGLKAYSKSSSGYSCPSDYNVTLKDNIGINGNDYTGNGNFKVCASSDGTQFQITGITKSSKICIYPMLVKGSGEVQLLETPQCFGITGAAINVSFKSKDINYMSIVDFNLTNQMNSCLSSASPCPSHSEGFVQ